jgi:phosphatidylglycerol:prolipoprotein diacylglycerol transferase
MIDPIALQLGPLAIRWYGISYALSLAIGIGVLILLNKRTKVFKDANQIVDLCFWLFLLGVLLGGRLGYILFYNFPFYLEHPAKVFAIWEGGMSFHGGFIGALVVALVWLRKHKISFWKAADMIVIPGALAPSLTRIANFINQELVGRVIENPKWQWLGVDFGDGVLRYPSQLFQSANGVIIFLLMLLIFSRHPKTGILTASYFILQGLFRFITEFTRAPDPQIGYILNFFTLGQLLSLGMVGVGVGVWWYVSKSNSREASF